MPTSPKLWPTLLATRSLVYTAQSPTHPALTGQGIGAVIIHNSTPSTLTFNESGQWRSQSGYESHFTNTYRWTLLPSKSLHLEHLRFGPDKPVALFDMIPTGKSQWQSLTPHHCRQDCYHATLELQKLGFTLTWHIIGPKRSDIIHYTYSQ